MQHHQPAAVGGIVEGGAADFDPAEVQAGELAEHLIMIARDIDDPGPAMRALQNAPDDVIVRGRPVELLLQPPAINDVADQVHRLAVGVVEEVDQQLGIAPLGAEVDIADPDRAIGAAFRPLRLGNTGWAERKARDVIGDDVGQVGSRHGKSPDVMSLAHPVAAKCYKGLTSK